MKILLNEIMYSKNLTVRQVSILTGVSHSTVSDICNGAMPHMDTLEKLAKGLKKLAKGLNVRITDLFESPYK